MAYARANCANVAGRTIAKQLSTAGNSKNPADGVETGKLEAQKAQEKPEHNEKERRKRQRNKNTQIMSSELKLGKYNGT